MKHTSLKEDLGERIARTISEKFPWDFISFQQVGYYFITTLY